MSTIGVATIARNAADMLEMALDPFLGLVDRFSIVLGGVSQDDTDLIAAQYPGDVLSYPGPLDAAGRLLDFGAARQQSFDALATDWVIVVDADDVWSGLEHLQEAIDVAEERGATAIMVPYLVSGLEMYQLRIYRRDAGHWEMPIHEYFRMSDDALTIKTNWLRLSQQARSPEDSQARTWQNVAVAERWLLEHETAPGEQIMHALAHLSKDYAGAGQYDKCLEIADRYLKLTDGKTRQREICSVLYHRAGVALITGRYDLALPAALAALNVFEDGRDSGPAWALLAEIFQTMSGGKAALNELAVFAADRALSSGRARNGYARDNRMSLTGALSVKADALERLGRLEAARGALDVGLMIDPEHRQMKTALNRVCTRLEELP